MDRMFLSLLFSLIVGIYTSNAEEYGRDWKGNVSKVIISEEKESWSFFKMRRVTHSTPTYSHEFDAEGRATRICRYADGEVFIEETFSYDDKTGRRVGETRTKGNVTRKCETVHVGNEEITSFFDRNGQLYIQEFKTIDTKGNVEKKEERWADGLTNYKTTYEYDEQSRLTSSHLYFGSGLLKEVTRWKYDENGRVAERSLHSNDGVVFEKEVYDYDAAGNVVGKEVSGKLHRHVQQEFYTYEFDAHGNWTRMGVSSEKGGTPKSFVRRLIEYWER